MDSITANHVAVVETEDGNALVIVFSERDDGTGRSLALQRALSFDEQDVRLGQDTYFLTTESGAVHYGGVRPWELDETHARFILDESACASFEVDDGYEIRLTTVHPGLADEVARALGPMSKFVRIDSLIETRAPVLTIVAELRRYARGGGDRSALRDHLLELYQRARDDEDLRDLIADVADVVEGHVGPPVQVW